MKLPSAHLAVVDREKITDYLLNAAHPDNGGKAAFFQGIGFASADWETFAVALRARAAKGDVSKSVESNTGASTLWTAGSRRRVDGRRWYAASGSSTADSTSHGWSRRIRRKNEGSDDQRT